MAVAIKRHSGLKPFSRDHGVDLVCVQGLQRAVRTSRSERIRLAQEMKSVCNHIILTYLDDEQAILLPIISNPILRQKFRDHHAHIRQLARALNKIEPHEDPGLGFFALIGDAIDDYVRWEERVLFPTIESDLSEEQLRSLERSSRNMDIRRQRPTQVLHRSVSP